MRAFIHFTRLTVYFSRAAATGSYYPYACGGEFQSEVSWELIAGEVTLTGGADDFCANRPNETHAEFAVYRCEPGSMNGGLVNGVDQGCIACAVGGDSAIHVSSCARARASWPAL